MTRPPERICVTILAHNEEKRIARCLRSLPMGDPQAVIHVVVNGSTDGTADRARGAAEGFGNVHVHSFEEGGKSRSWNRFVLDTLEHYHPVHIFVDGDAIVVPGSIAALADTIESRPFANAASALPRNGRNVQAYQAEVKRTHGLFGDLYALRGDFILRMKRSGIRLPDDLVGDDGLIASLAKTDLGNLREWNENRIEVCCEAGFLCDPIDLFDPSDWLQPYRRMIAYSVRHFQVRIIKEILAETGPGGLPRRLAELYASHLAGFSPRAHPSVWWFDRCALRRMAQAGGGHRGSVPERSGGATI